jgi:tetratricopeptide (TPR) repeat protein
MRIRLQTFTGFPATAVIISLLASPFAALGQSDLVPVSDITGGSTVFRLKGGSGAAPKRYVSKTRASRTKAQRIEATRKVSGQYVALAKKDPRRTRTAVVTPDRLAEIRRMPPEQASKLFAGVGEYWNDREDFKQSSEFFGEAYQLDKNNEIARMGLSESLALLGNVELANDNIPSARARFREALTYNEKNAPAYFGLAEIAAAEENDVDAAANYEKALLNDSELTSIYVPLGILYYQQGQIAKAEDLLTRALAIDKNDAQMQYFIGLIRYAQNENEGALAAFKAAAALDSNYEEAFHYIGETLSRSGKYTDAIIEYKKAIAIRENYFEAWFGLANAQYQLGDHADAIVSYQRALKLNNTNVEGYLNVGDANRLLGRYNDAEANYSLAISFIERDPDHDKTELADIYSKVGYVIAKQCELDQKRGIACRLDGSLRALEKAADLSAESLNNGNLGWAYLNAGRYDLYFNRKEAGREKLLKAKDLLERAAGVSGAGAEGILLNLASVHGALADNAAAADVLKRALALNPRSTHLLNELGMAYMRASNFKEAASQFKKAVSGDDKFAQGYYNLGAAEFKNGNLGEAKKAYKKLRSLAAPEAAQYAVQLEKLTNGAVKS